MRRSRMLVYGLRFCNQTHRLRFDAAEGRFDFVNGVTRQILVDFFNDPARNFLMIVFAQLTQCARWRNHHESVSLLKSPASARWRSKSAASAAKRSSAI